MFSTRAGAWCGLAAAGLLAAGCASTSDSHSVEYKFATLDSNSLPASEDDPAVAPYRNDLTSLQNECTESREGLGNMAVKAQSLLDERGYTFSLLAILDNALTLARADHGGNPGKCAPDFALAIVALENG